MGAAVRAPTVAAGPVVMGFFDKKEEAPKKVAKKTVPPASRPPGSSSAATQRLHGRPASPPTVPCEAAHGALCTAQVKKVVKKSAKKGSAAVSQGDFKTNSGPLGTAKAFFSFGNKEEADNIATQDNWAFQAFNTLKDLPSSKGRRYGD